MSFVLGVEGVSYKIKISGDGLPKWNPPADAKDMGSIPGLGRSSGEGNGNPLQYSCLGNPKDREA